MLNALGYGTNPALKLDLVYNPTGIHLPPSRDKLQVDYTRVLREKYDIVFNDLICITNIPINRFYDFLKVEGQLDTYVVVIIMGV